MTVLLNIGRKNRNAAIGQILDAYLTDQDYQRGILLKPNIVFPVRPGSGEITSPWFVKELILALRERQNNIDIIIGEGVAAGCNPRENFQISGFTKLADELNVPLVDFNCTERTTVAWKFGQLKLPSIALERTYINLPILKYSSACVISGALKNQKGLLLPKDKKRFHRLGLHEQIAELNVVVKPSLTMMDCSRFFGRNVFLSGDNCGEIDATACHLLGVDEPEHVHLSRIKQVYDSGYTVKIQPPSIRLKFSPPNAKAYKHIGRLRLWSNPQACTMCREVFRIIKQNIYKPHNISLGVKLLSYSINGAEVVMGSNPKWQKEFDTTICVGTCTRQLAKEGGYIYIPGCPPTMADFKKYLP